MVFPREGSEEKIPFPKKGDGNGHGNGGSSASTAVESPPTIRRFSDYTILETIGSGLRGTVFRASKGPGRIVALKVFNPGVGVDLEALRRFAPISDGGISHPNLVPVEAVGVSDGQAFYSMALLQGDSLEEILSELKGLKRLRPHLSPLRPLSDGQPRPGFIRHAISLILQVAEGLDRAHRSGVIHGRLSPQNLILNPAGRLVVTDFGAEEAKEGPRRLGGGASHDLKTLAYRAPEQIESSDPVDGRADVYALGAILYELLTRQKPFAGRDPRKVQEMILEGRLRAPSQVAPKVTREAEAVILRAMAVGPEDRYATAGEMAEDLRRLLILEATRAGAEVPDLPQKIEGVPEEPPADAKPPEPPRGSEERSSAEPGSFPAIVPALAERPREKIPDPGAAGIGPAPWIYRDAPPPESAPAPETRPQEKEEATRKDRPRSAGADLILIEVQPMAAEILRPPDFQLPSDPSWPAGSGAIPAVIPGLVPESPREAPALRAADAGPRDWLFHKGKPGSIGSAAEAPAARRGGPLASFLSTVLILAAIGGWTWFTLNLHETGERHRLSAERFSMGLERLEKAVFAIFYDESSSARDLVSQARDLGIADPNLESIEGVLKSRAEDPALSDLSHPRSAVRAAAIDSILREVKGGARPASDLAWIQGLLRDGELSVRLAAISSLEIGGSSAPLLSAYPIGEGLPILEIDGPTFLALAGALASIGDAPAETLLLGWSFDDFARLDGLPEGEGAFAELPPNLRIALDSRGSSDFASAWIRGRSLLRSGDLISLAGRLRRGETKLLPLAFEVIGALPSLGKDAAAPALASLAAPLHLTQGVKIIESLSRLGAVRELLSLSRSSLPGALRALAISEARASISPSIIENAPGVAEEISGILLRDPDPDVRRSALLALRGFRGKEGREALAGALLDPALEEEALALLRDEPPQEALPVLLEILRRGDGHLRALAARAAGAVRDPRAFGPLGALLLEEDREVRAAALAALREISLPRALILAAGILPAGCPELREMALEAAKGPRGPIDTPALFLLALREALGAGDGVQSPPGLREARRWILREQAAGLSSGTFPRLPPRAGRLAEDLR